MDPQLPRYYKFLVLFTRITIMFGVSFYLLRNIDNFDSFKTNGQFIGDILRTAIIGGIGSLIFIPIPIFFFGLCRSKYFLIKPEKIEQESESDRSQKSQKSKLSTKRKLLRERMTKVQIDVNMPLKLLFNINSISHDKFIEEEKTNYKFTRGNTLKVAKILSELDIYEKTIS